MVILKVIILFYKLVAYFTHLTQFRKQIVLDLLQNVIPFIYLAYLMLEYLKK